MYWTKPQKNHFCFVFLHTFDDHDWHVLDVCACVCNQCTISTLLTLLFFFFSNEHSTGNSLNSQMNVSNEKFFYCLQIITIIGFCSLVLIINYIQVWFLYGFSNFDHMTLLGQYEFPYLKKLATVRKKTKMVEKICSNIICVWA